MHSTHLLLQPRDGLLQGVQVALVAVDARLQPLEDVATHHLLDDRLKDKA